MATLAEIWNLRQTGNLKPRASAAVARAAQDVLAEDVSTTNHTNRVLWAKAALRDADGECERMLWGICGNATIQANGSASTDNDIQWVVNSLVDTFATGV